MLACQAFLVQKQTHFDTGNFVEGDAPIGITLAIKGKAGLSGMPLKRQTHLDKGNLLEGDAPIGLHHLMQGHESAEHGLHIGLPKVLPAGFLQRLVPHLMPQNGHANQLLTHLQMKLVMFHTGHAEPTSFII